MPISLVERLTDQQLQILSEQWRPAAIEITALRARVAKLETALEEIEFHGGPVADFARAALKGVG